MKGKNWTNEEVNKLSYMWGYFSIDEIAKKLNRTPTAITVKYKRLKLGSPYKRKNRFTARQVSDFLGVDIHTVTDYWIAKCGLRVNKKPYRKKSYHLIDYDDLMEWLEKNQGKWDSRKLKKFALYLEPKWLGNKRILDEYEPKRKNQKWTHREDLKLWFLFYKKYKTLNQIAQIMERTENGCERRLSRIRPYKNKKILVGVK